MLQHPLLPYSPATVAEFCYTELDRAAAARGHATLAIPGGRSPGPVLELLAGMMDDFLRPRLHLLWVDERAVPANHADRNDAPTLAAWDRGGPRPGGVHPMPADGDNLEAAAEEYGRLLARLQASQGLDIALLGIGEDGHFASCFPNHPGLEELGPVFAVYDSPKPPAKRLSLARSVISGSQHLIILAMGAAKGARIGQALLQEAADNPVSLLPGERCRVFCDDEALQAATQGGAEG